MVGPVRVKTIIRLENMYSADGDSVSGNYQLLLKMHMHHHMSDMQSLSPGLKAHGNNLSEEKLWRKK